MLVRKSPSTLTAVSYGVGINALSATRTLTTTTASHTQPFTTAANQCASRTFSTHHFNFFASTAQPSAATVTTTAVTSVEPNKKLISLSSLALWSPQRFYATATASATNTNGETAATVHQDRQQENVHAESVKQNGSEAEVDEVPPVVQQRINSNKLELLRLLRCATEDSATTTAPASKLDAVFRTQLEFADLAQRFAATPSSAAPSSQSRSGVPSSWTAAMWTSLAPHCYFTMVNAAPISAPHNDSKTSSQSAFSSRAQTRTADRDRNSKQVVCVCPFDWASAVEHLAASLPYEGWSEQQAYTHLRLHHRVLETHTPVWLPRYTQADSLARFLHQHFAALILVTRSAVTGEPILHRVGHNSVAITWTAGKPNPTTLSSSASSLSPSVSALRTDRPSVACTALQHALHVLGRGHQLPVWTDASALVPLLSTQSGFTSASPTLWRTAWLRDAALRGCFHIDAYVRLRALPPSSRILWVVDTTTVSLPALQASLEKDDAAFVKRNAPAAGGVGATVKLLVRSQTSASMVQDFHRFFTEQLGASAVVDTVVVDALLEPQHLLGALLEAESVAAAAQHARPDSDKGSGVTEAQVRVVCGEASRDVFAETLKDVKLPGLEVSLLSTTA
ncbi:hypothetical protein N2W54_003786 [Lotmaria passim]